MVVGGDIGALSYSQLSTLLQKLELFLHTGDRVVSIKLISLTGLPHSGDIYLLYLFIVLNDVCGSSTSPSFGVFSYSCSQVLCVILDFLAFNKVT